METPRFHWARRITAAAVLALLYLGATFPRPLFRPDEFRYAEIAREMRSGSRWLVPHLDGLCYFEKPLLGHWCNALMQQIVGEIPAAVRLAPAAMTLLGLGFLFYLLRKCGEEKIAAPATLMTALSALVFGVGTYGVLDGIFAPLVWVTCGFFFLGYRAAEKKEKACFLLLAGLAAGIAFHAKGLLAFLLPALAAALFLILQKKYKKLLTDPLLPLLGALLTALPLAWMVHRADGDFWRQFLWVEHFQRMLTGAGANDDRSQPFYYYLPILIGGLMPWLLFLPAAIKGWKAGGVWERPLIRFAAVAAVSWFLFFSLSKAKLGTYILPLIPFAMILLAAGLKRYAESGKTSLINGTLKAIAVAGIAAAALLFATQLVFGRLLPASSRWVLYGLKENAQIPFVALAVGLGYFPLAAARNTLWQMKFGLFCAGIWIVFAAVPFSVPRRFTADSAPEAFFTAICKKEMTPDAIVAADRGLASAACWSLKRSDLYVFGRPGELQYGLTRAPERQIGIHEVRKWLAEGRKVIIFTNSRKVIKSLSHLPQRKFRRGKNSIIICTGLPRSNKESLQ